MNASTSSIVPSATGKLDRLKALLREMFQLDRGDLDFGLYRIMNMKASEISAFLDNDLLPQVQEQLDLMDNQERVRLEKELQDAREQARKGGYDPDTQPSSRIIDLNRKLAEMQKDADTEADVYNHLVNFFARYYAEGDFISQRRYSSGGRAAYLIPYDGEEVKLHWANADQYYVKTTENYASYIFTVGTGESEKRVRFEIAAADNEKDNIKEADSKQRRFVLAGDNDAIAVEGGDLVVRFEHRPLTDSEKQTWTGNGVRQQERINEAVVKRILKEVASDWLALLAVSAPTDANSERTLLEKHVERYTAKNSFDYFIHKDLGGFLRRELDLYLNTEVLNLDDLEQGDAPRLDRSLARVRATRHIGGKIIDFLAQLEDFQKQLWLKKKFVLETNWCVTLDRVPEALYPEIVANTAQCEEWVELFAVDKIPGDLINGGTTWSNPPSVDFLKANPYLMLDTRHFDRDFTDRLLAALSDAGSLDEQLDGLLVHGENFQALNLLQARYHGQMECVYIDPPFNTDASPILYKNGYKSSTWVSLIESSLRVSRMLFTDSGILVAAIDDEQQKELSFLLSTVFNKKLLGTILVRTNPSGRPTQSGYSVAHEYLLYAGVGQGTAIERMPPTKEQAARFSKRDARGVFEWRNLRREGSNSDRTARPALYYPIYLKGTTIRIPQMTWNPVIQEWIIEEKPRAGEQIVFPDNEMGIQKTWRWEAKTVMSTLQDIAVRKDRSGRDYIYYKRRPHNKGVMSMSCWFDAKYSSVEHGTVLLKAMFGKTVFSYPKSIHAVMDSIYTAGASRADAQVLDFFAGSGTTGHAVVNLNREDGGQRKYVLVEIGDYFDTVLLPRIKKVIYSPDWKDGKPLSRNGVTQLFKYIRLESYEDTMDSLEVKPPSGEQQDLLTQNPAVAEDYRLRYALGVETAGSACLLGKAFADPFTYTLSVVRDGVRREVQVDLPETFNYLIGLRVASHQRIDGVLAITGMDPEGRNCLILWRNLDETDYAALDAWFDRNREPFAGPLDVIYTNGDHTLNAMQQPGENWTAKTIEPIFRGLMFGETSDEQ